MTPRKASRSWLLAFSGKRCGSMALLGLLPAARSRSWRCSRKLTSWLNASLIVDFATVRSGSLNLDPAEHAKGGRKSDNILGNVREKQLVPLNCGVDKFVEMLFEGLVAMDRAEVLKHTKVDHVLPVRNGDPLL